MYNPIQIDTTQNVILQVEKATMGDRLLAFAIDSLIITGYYISMLIVFASIFFNGLSALFDGNNYWWIIVVSIPASLYHLLFEWLKDGQSPGKIVMKIKVATLDGTELSFGSIVLRWIFRAIDMMPFLFGIVALICIATTKNAQRIGDMIAGTTVIKLKDKVKLEDTIFEKIDEHYVPEFPEVSRLSSKDIEIIKKVIFGKEYRYNAVILDKLKTKIMTIMEVNSQLHAIDFLKKVVKDYSYYA